MKSKARSISPNLDRAAIVDGALKIVTAEGLDKLSTRTLAKRLGVKGPALYWHFPNKQALIGAMAEAILQDCVPKPRAKEPWPKWVRRCGEAMRLVLVAQRDGAQIAALAPPTRRIAVELTEELIAPLVASGIDPVVAHRAMGVMVSFLLGWTIHEQNKGMHDFIDRQVGLDAAFSMGLEAIACGLEALIKRRSG